MRIGIWVPSTHVRAGFSVVHICKSCTGQGKTDRFPGAHCPTSLANQKLRVTDEHIQCQALFSTCTCVYVYLHVHIPTWTSIKNWESMLKYQSRKKHRQRHMKRQKTLLFKGYSRQKVSHWSKHEFNVKTWRLFNINLVSLLEPGKGQMSPQSSSTVNQFTANTLHSGNTSSLCAFWSVWWQETMLPHSWVFSVGPLLSSHRSCDQKAFTLQMMTCDQASHKWFIPCLNVSHLLDLRLYF